MAKCKACGLETIKLNEKAYASFVEMCDNPPPPTDALKRALSRYPFDDGVMLHVSGDDLQMIRTAVFAKAWACPSDSSEESRWLALERRIWDQYRSHNP